MDSKHPLLKILMAHGFGFTILLGMLVIVNAQTKDQPGTPGDRQHGLKMKSERSFGETPYAVADLSDVGQKVELASLAISFSANTFVLAYAVRGFGSEVSSTIRPSEVPYTLHVEDKINFFTPAFFANSASFTDDS